ncbi:MAG TPA: glycosyltransferase family 2 protein [Nevskia sp.]|nr:glycosyltransferase family 2 protein [Nevskia sp.]
MALLQPVFALALLPLAAGCAYLLLLTLCSARSAPPPPARGQLKFDILVPAHNEAATIARTIASLRRLRWPAQRFRILVVCDNCSDDTAPRARAAGAVALERRDDSRRGKGHALRHGFDASLREGWADAVLVVDADSEVTPNLLEACAARIERGARAVQAHYAVLNPQASPRTRLMALAFACIHPLRSRARQRLGLSCGIRGNGWCVHRLVLRDVPYAAYTLAEDVEYGVALGLAGVRVEYADEAQVLGEMVSTEAAARSQRLRWEGGRGLLLRRQLPPLLRRAWRSALCLDLAADLLLPPLSWLVLGAASALPPAALAALLDRALAPWLWLDLACLGALVLYVARGWSISGLGATVLPDLLRVPGFVAWKLRLMLAHSRPAVWVRTTREPS